MKVFVKHLPVVFLSLLGFIANAQTETLKFGINAAYPPFEFKNSNNETVGFDIDIANSICEDLKVKCQFTDLPFDSLIPSLQFKKFDAIISALDANEDRAKVVSFSDSYFQSSAIFIVNKGKNITQIDNLKGKKIGVLNGSTQQRYLDSVYKDSEIKAYPHYTFAMTDLINGRIDLVFGDETTGFHYLKDNPDLETVGGLIDNSDFFGKGLSIAVRKNDQPMLDKINNSLHRIKESGKYAEIYKKWFGHKLNEAKDKDPSTDMTNENK